MEFAFVASALALGLVPALLILLWQENHRRRHVEEALRQTARELDERVRQRTEELTAANEALQAEIAKRHQAEASLRASEDTYRIIADNTHAMEYWIDPDGRFVYVSPSCERITGCMSTELMADPDLLQQLVHPEDRAQLIEHHQRATRGDPAEEIEFRLIRRDGTERWIAHSCQSLFDAAGQYLGRRASLRDITPQKHAEEEIHRLNHALELRVAMRTAELKATVDQLQAEIVERRRADKALREVQARFSGIFHASKDAISYADLDGVLLEVNDAYCQLTGYAREDLVGVMKYQDLTPPEFYPVMTVKMAELLRTGVPVEYEKELVRRDGTRVPIWLTVFVVPGEGDRPAGVAGIIKDITERKRAEAALQRAHEELETRVRERTAALSRANDALQAEIAERLQAEARLHEERYFAEALVDSLPGVYYLFDAQGHFVRGNKNLERVTGYSAEEIARMHLADFFAGDDRRLIAERIQKVFARGQSTAEAQFVSKDGTRRPYFFTGQRVVLQGTPFLVGMGIDITERKRAEEALAAQKQLLDTILEQAADGILVRDAQGRVLFANAAMKRLAWRPPEDTALDVAGEIWGKTTDAGGKALAVDEWPVVRALRGETVRGLELHRVAADGTPYVFLNSCAPVRNDRGEIIAAVAINADITERKAAEERFRLVVEGAPNAILAVDRHGRVALVNSQVERLFGYAREELLGQPVELLLPERYRTGHAREPDLFMQRPEARPGGGRGELFGLRKDGSEVPLEIGLNPIQTGRETLVLASMFDLTARREAEERLRNSLKEKEALLQEVHHRVKNNLQLISSLLRLQALELRDPPLRAVFDESRARIQAMALVHERLYRGGSLEAPDYEAYLKELVAGIGRAFRQGNTNVTWEVLASAVGLGARAAVPIGLIVNELVSNSLKHGFPEGRKGRILVQLGGTHESGYELSVHDDGIGLPAEFSIERAKSMGLRLVDMLVRQLHGQLEIRRDAGTECRIHFRAENTSEEGTDRVRGQDASSVEKEGASNAPCTGVDHGGSHELRPGIDHRG